MKKIKFACNLSLLTLLALGQWACEWDPYEHDSDPVRETLELTALRLPDRFGRKRPFGSRY